MKYLYIYIVFMICLKSQAQDIDYSLNVVGNVTFEDMKKGFNEVPNEAKTKVFGLFTSPLTSTCQGELIKSLAAFATLSLSRSNS
jgi:hypothetical protein